MARTSLHRYRPVLQITLCVFVFVLTLSPIDLICLKLAWLASTVWFDLWDKTTLWGKVGVRDGPMY